MNYALEIKNLTKTYQDFKLDDITLTVPSGCIMGVIGENGAGKSTTIKLILDLIHRESGEIRILGQNLHNGDKDIKEHIGVVLDECCFAENISANDVNTIMRCTYRTWSSEKFMEFIKKFSLPFKKPVKEYSRGMKMKLSIAVALSHDSKFLILDEATGGLDPVVRDEILDIFLEFIQDESHSILISSHIVSDLEKICDYITFLHKGRVVFSEEKDALLEKYGILKCSQEDFKAIDKSIIKGYRENSFGVEALVEKKKISRQLTIDPATIEEIMLFLGKETVS